MSMLDAFAHVKRLAADYRTMTDAYDEELLAAHNAGHGTLQGMEHLRKANAMAPYVLDLLTRYQAAVAGLAAAIANEVDQESRVQSGRRRA